MKILNRQIWILSIAIFSFACTPYEAVESNSENLSSIENSLPPVEIPEDAPLGTLNASMNAKMKLGEIATYNMIYIVDSRYTGLVRLNVDRSSLANIEGESDVLLTLTPSIVEVNPGDQINIEVSIDVPYRSPSFDPQELKLIASDSSGRSIETIMTLEIEAALRIELRECDYQNNNQLDDCWNLPENVDLRSHSGNIELQFVNCDPSLEHIVHGNGPIDHQSVNNPMPPAISPDQCQGMYVATVPGNTLDSGTYYMHDTQSNSQRRTINFSVANPAAASIQAKATSTGIDRFASGTGETCDDPQGRP